MTENLDLSGKVIAVVHPETNELINVSSKNPEYCSVRVESAVLSNDEGLLVFQTRIAKVRMQTVLAQALQAKGMLEAGKELPIKGKIIIREGKQPFYEGQEPKINPRTGEVIEHIGSPVYRQTVFTSNDNARDMFIRDYYTAGAADMLTEQVGNGHPVAFEQFMQAEFA